MDKETLENLLTGQPKEIRAKGVLLFNGVANGAQAYQKAPTSANLRDWETAEAALAKFVAQISVSEEKPLVSVADVLGYLTANGWRVTKTSLYRHQKEGKILPRSDGAYELRAVDKYARAWLKQLSTGQRINERMDELQRRKIEMELQNLSLEVKRKEFGMAREMGRYIPREDMEMELAGRAGIINAGLKHWVQSRAAEWIRAVDGNHKKVGELINLMNRDLDDHINAYAAPIEYQIVFDAEEKEETPALEMMEDAVQ